ncbi:MFS transporter [Streptomyces sp. ODS28]|uniref:MFS transporter n=1 Tax=Streptomyces sp. ODS28 TaxID=3136688 RepID=UPI0031F06175
MSGTTLGGGDRSPAVVEVSLEIPELPGGAEQFHGAAAQDDLQAQAATHAPAAYDPTASRQAPPVLAPRPQPGQGPPAPGPELAGQTYEEEPAPEEDGSGGEDAGPRFSPRRVRFVFLGLMLALLLAALEQTIVATALPRIVGELHGLDRMSWVVTAYLLATTVVMPVYGRLGDLFGHKNVFQFSIVVFLLGSGLAGWAGSMDELVIYRAVQGAGAGGLMIGVQAIMGEIVPARQRGRYMGLIGAVFGLASIAGPLLGGWLTDAYSWRWCFYLNVPGGLLTLLVVGLVLRMPRPRDRGRMDVIGPLLLGVFSTCLVLLTSWGGTTYEWDHPVILGLGAGGLSSLLLFLIVEHSAAEPILPLRLFRDQVFTLTGLIGAAVGVTLFGASSYLPTFLQMVEGVSATESGLLMVPMMGGVVVASVLSGQLISRTGRYKVFVVLGCALAAEGMWLLSGLGEDTPRETYSLWLGVLGLGIGFVVPVLVLAVQNSVPATDLGAATSGNNYFRQAGGSAGAAVFGTLFAHRLAEGLRRELPPDPGVRLPDPQSVTPQLVHALPEPLREGYVRAYADAMPRIFLYLVPVLLLGLLLALFLKEKTLVSHNAPVPGSTAGDGTAPGPHVPGTRGTAARSAEVRTTVECPPAGVPVCGSVRHHDGSTVPRAALTLIDTSGRQVGRGATGDDGRYALSTPGSGAYVMIAAAGGHQPQAVSVSVGEHPVELDVVLGGAGRLAGNVLTADGLPVRDASVTLTDVRGDVVASTRSGREGGYVIGELVAGEYTLAASAPAYRPAALPVSVQASRETRQDIELAGGAVLRGTVRANGGRAVEDARVTLLDAAGNVVDTATTGADGGFRFVDLASGEYTVVASGYPPVATVLQIAGGGRTERDLQLGHED